MRLPRCRAVQGTAAQGTAARQSSATLLRPGSLCRVRAPHPQGTRSRVKSNRCPRDSAQPPAATGAEPDRPDTDTAVCPMRQYWPHTTMSQDGRGNRAASEYSSRLRNGAWVLTWTVEAAPNDTGRRLTVFRFGASWHCGVAPALALETTRCDPGRETRSRDPLEAPRCRGTARLSNTEVASADSRRPTRSAAPSES
jgi:hypothetical protein